MTGAEIIRAVAESHGLGLEQVKGRSQLPRIVAARIEIANRLRAERGLSTGKIGLLLGRTTWTARYYLDAALRSRKNASRRKLGRAA